MRDPEVEYYPQEQVYAVRWTCGGCGKEVIQLADEGEEVPAGFHGSVMHIGDHGGTGGEFFACKETCIRKAVLKAEER